MGTGKTGKKGPKRAKKIKDKSREHQKTREKQISGAPPCYICSSKNVCEMADGCVWHDPTTKTDEVSMNPVKWVRQLLNMGQHCTSHARLTLSWGKTISYTQVTDMATKIEKKGQDDLVRKFMEEQYGFMRRVEERLGSISDTLHALNGFAQQIETKGKDNDKLTDAMKAPLHKNIQEVKTGLFDSFRKFLRYEVDPWTVRALQRAARGWPSVQNDGRPLLAALVQVLSVARVTVHGLMQDSEDKGDDNTWNSKRGVTALFEDPGYLWFG